jgi:hypothetical protein
LRSLIERFLENVNYNGPIHPVLGTRCHLWTGKLSYRFGYGLLSVKGKWIGAHRWIYQHVHGPLVEGECVLHRCDAPACVNVDHLFRGTRADNVYDMVAKHRNRPVRGEAMPTAKLSYQEADTIRWSHDVGGLTIALLARWYEVSESTIWRIVQGITWIRPLAT